MCKFAGLACKIGGSCAHVWAKPQKMLSCTATLGNCTVLRMQECRVNMQEYKVRAQDFALVSNCANLG